MDGRDTPPKVAKVVSSMSKSDSSDRESIPQKCHVWPLKLTEKQERRRRGESLCSEVSPGH